jgi:hypothetical protein
MSYVEGTWGNVITHGYFLKEFDITNGGALYKWDMEMVMWLIKFLFLW